MLPYLKSAFGELSAARVGLVDEPIVLTDAHGIAHQVTQKGAIDDFPG